MKQSRVTSQDGLSLAVYEAGNPDGAEILFLHGFSQSALCWHLQMENPALLARFRMVAYDIRGHGGSDQPDDPARYAAEADFAADTMAVIAAMGLRRPVLVGWSYAGRLINDYLRAHGTTGIAGINYVAARTNSDPSHNGPGNAFLRDMIRLDLEREIKATENFLRACFFLPPPEHMLTRARFYNMRVRPQTRRAHLMRAPDDGAVLATIDLPVLVTQGSRDQLVLPGMSQHTATTVPGAELSLYSGVGHMPFAESPDRFNLELTAFVSRCQNR
ncbi:MAG: alpha/beta hydrolase [bacterium]